MADRRVTIQRGPLRRAPRAPPLNAWSKQHRDEERTKSIAGIGLIAEAVRIVKHGAQGLAYSGTVAQGWLIARGT